MSDDHDERLMPEKTLEWLQREALRLCKMRVGCHHLEAVVIGRTRPQGSSPNWELLAFKPELPIVAENEAMEVIHFLRGTYALKPR
jgi:hypothetical protein